MGFVSHLQAAIDGTVLPAGEVQTVHANRPIWVRYDLDAIGRAVSVDDFSRRHEGMWRYRELLPLPADADPVSLGENMSPLLPVPQMAAALGASDLWIKDESTLPTASFKSRGMSMAVSMATHFGLRRFAVPTAGNAGGALASYAARAGAESFVFMPMDTPAANQHECVLAGSTVHLVDGLINDCGWLVREGKEAMGWFDFSTLKEPYRIEGKKTMGLELAEQAGWTLPHVILYPTGGGTGLIGMWKAFAELRELGWLRCDHLPRMISVQSDGCAPIVRAFETGDRFAQPWENAVTCASGLRVPVAVGDFMILDAIRESGGCAVAAEESRIDETMRRCIATEGIALCPESAACVIALEKLLADGRVAPDERIVIFNTGSAGKYYPMNTPDLPVISDIEAFDFSQWGR
ncbi:MAG: threonine synthase [Planctomycetota bacterium]